jgi:hypothetical protein
MGTTLVFSGCYPSKVGTDEEADCCGIGRNIANHACCELPRNTHRSMQADLCLCGVTTTGGLAPSCGECAIGDSGRDDLPPLLTKAMLVASVDTGYASRIAQDSCPRSSIPI